MESQLIDSLTNDQFSKGMQPLASRMLNAKALKNMRIITELISPPAELSKDPQHKDPFERIPYLLKVVSSDRGGRIFGKVS